MRFGAVKRNEVQVTPNEMSGSTVSLLKWRKKVCDAAHGAVMNPTGNADRNMLSFAT
jgi:hypothetical protein